MLLSSLAATQVVAADNKTIVTAEVAAFNPSLGITALRLNTLQYGISYFQTSTKNNFNNSYEYDQNLGLEGRYFANETYNVSGSIFYRYKTIDFGEGRGSHAEPGVKAYGSSIGISFALGHMWQFGSLVIGGDWLEVRKPLILMGLSTSGTGGETETRAHQLKTDAKEANRQIQTTLGKFKIGWVF